MVNACHAYGTCHIAYARFLDQGARARGWLISLSAIPTPAYLPIYQSVLKEETFLSSSQKSRLDWERGPVLGDGMMRYEFPREQSRESTWYHGLNGGWGGGAFP